MAPGADTDVHDLCQRFIFRAIEHAVPQGFVCPFSFLRSPAAPIGDVVQQTALAPFYSVPDRAVGEQAAPIAREVLKIGGFRRGASGEYSENEEKDQEEKITMYSSSSLLLCFAAVQQ